MTLREAPENLLCLERDLCCGCTHCLRVCPTEAIRIRRGKAEVIRHRCIECGRCLGACPRGAWKVPADSPEEISQGKSAALLDPAVFWQFGPSFRNVPAAVQEMGFARVEDLGGILEGYTAAGREYLAGQDRPRPAISSFCPAVAQLIQVKFPSLLENLMPILSPYEMAFPDPHPSDEANAEEVYAVVPCLAQASLVRRLSPKNTIGGVIALADAFNPIKARLPRKESPGAQGSEQGLSYLGLKWAAAGAESEALGVGNVLIVDGIHQVSRVLNLAESGLLDAVSFIEPWACETGCLGGPLNVENPFVARYHLSGWARGAAEKRERPEAKPWESLKRPPLNARPGMRLDANLKKAMEKLARIDEVVKKFPGLDCGSCGCPSCLALAEDVVQGRARVGDCIHRRRRK